MEGREGMNSGVTVIGAEAPSAYHVAPRSENPSESHITEPAAVGASMVTVGSDGIIGKKKRGRPRKYGPDGAVAMALISLPSSSSSPPANDLSAGKRAKAKGTEYKQRKKVGIDHIGELKGSSIGTSFTPHIITVNAGEDITMKVISFSQQGPRAICILSANGVISNVTLRQPDSSGGTLTYEGRFEILSLSGSFMPTESQGARSRSGGMSVSLASPDGRVVGGGVAGLLVAASPVQVVVGSFLPSSQHDQKPKKHKHDYAPGAVMRAVPMAYAAPLSNAEKEDGMDGHRLQNSGTMNANISPSSTYQRENWVTMHTMPDSRNLSTDINMSLPESCS
ncbi:AT-hook motif nuclear-localized protein 1 [Quillaja saponaria]|uniref:AT-hook motif nuclear-localized protein n=1 Tax=Quillaja saponaria TaxID=32244 RepID=A0AAD7PPK2_QUISA|nr:AT-hook motif nuclear-localized protein 1 [Quillaja saponaria]